MAVNMNASGMKGSGKSARGKLPVKRTINLAAVGEEKLNVKLAIPGVILVVAAAVLLSKFGVVDRLSAVSHAEGAAASLQTELDSVYANINAYSSLEEDYAHYTFSGMTEEELSRVDRAEIIALIQRTLRPGDSAGSWSAAGNQLTLEVRGDTLQQINELARLFEKDPMVDFCTVTNANMTEQQRESTVTVVREVPVTPEEAPEEAPENEEVPENEEAPADEAAPAETETVEEEQTVVETVQSVRANIIVYLQKPGEDNSQ